MRIEVVQADITTQDVDVIVNAANSSLLGGGGVDGAIHRAAGPAAAGGVPGAASHDLPRRACRSGSSVATPGFDLPARWVVHTVGPNWHAGERATWRCSRAASSARSRWPSGLGATSIAFPAVSAGVYGWDVAEVARIAVTAARAWESGADDSWEQGHKHPTGIALTRFVLFSDDALAAFERALAH